MRVGDTDMCVGVCVLLCAQIWATSNTDELLLPADPDRRVRPCVPSRPVRPESKRVLVRKFNANTKQIFVIQLIYLHAIQTRGTLHN